MHSQVKVLLLIKKSPVLPGYKDVRDIIILYLIETKPPSDGLLMVCKSNRLPWIKYILDNSELSKTLEYTYDDAAKILSINYNIEGLQYMFSKRKCLGKESMHFSRAFYHAVKDNNLDIVKKIVNDKFDLSCIGKFGCVLERAIEKKSIDMLAYLLDTNMFIYSCQSLTNTCVSFKALNVLLFLIRKIPDIFDISIYIIDFLRERGLWNDIFYCVDKGINRKVLSHIFFLYVTDHMSKIDMNMVHHLVRDKKADINYDITLLNTVVKKGHIELTRFLLNNRIGLLSNTWDRENMFTRAVKTGNRDIINVFIEKENIDYTQVYIHDALLTAAEFKNDDIAISLINNDSCRKIIIQDPLGSVVDLYAKKNNVEMIKFLLEIGVNIGVNKNCIICGFASHGNMEMVKYLIEKGANLKIESPSIILNTIDGKNLELLKYLVSMKIPLNSWKKDGFTVRAVEVNSPDFVRYLIQLGMNFHCNGERALNRAVNNKNLEIIKILVEAGADINRISYKKFGSSDDIEISSYFYDVKRTRLMKKMKKQEKFE